jgi:hypothetical protein
LIVEGQYPIRIFNESWTVLIDGTWPVTAPLPFEKRHPEHQEITFSTPA